MKEIFDNIKEIPFQKLITLSNNKDLTQEEKEIIDNEFNRRIDKYLARFGDSRDKYHL